MDDNCPQSPLTTNNKGPTAPVTNMSRAWRDSEASPRAVLRRVLVRMIHAGETLIFTRNDMELASTSKGGRRIDRPKFILAVIVGMFILYAYQAMVPWQLRISAFPHYRGMRAAMFPPTAATQVSPADVIRGTLVTSPDPGAQTFNITQVLLHLTLATIVEDVACAGAAHFGIPIPAVVLAFATPADPFKPEVHFQPSSFSGQQGVNDWAFTARDLVSLGVAVTAEESADLAAPRAPNKRFLFMLNPECVDDDTEKRATTERIHPCFNSGLSTNLGVAKIRSQSVVCHGRFVRPTEPKRQSPSFTIKLFKHHAICMLNHYDLASRDTQLCVNQTRVGR